MLDAATLWKAGRSEGSLLMVLVSIEATARERFPEGTKSREHVDQKTGKPKNMGDGEAFCAFLDAELVRHKCIRMRLLMTKPPTDPPTMPEEFDNSSLPEHGVWDPDDPESYLKAEQEWFVAFKAKIEARDAAWKAFRQRQEKWAKDADKYLMSIDRVFWKLCRCKICHRGKLAPNVKFVDQPGLSSSLDKQSLELSFGWVRQLAITVIWAEENKGMLSDDIREFWRSESE